MKTHLYGIIPCTCVFSCFEVTVIVPYFGAITVTIVKLCINACVNQLKTSCLITLN